MQSVALLRARSFRGGLNSNHILIVYFMFGVKRGYNVGSLIFWFEISDSYYGQVVSLV